MAVEIKRLQAEHHESGLGLGAASPRLSWSFEGQAKGWTQQGYEVVVKRGDRPEAYSVTSPQSVLAPWPSTPLSSCESALVRVRAIGKDGSITGWKELRVEAALLTRDDWKAKMVGAPKRQVDEPKRPVRLFKRFSVAQVPLKARLYCTAFGIYEACLNGRRIGDQLLAPGWQSYSHHLNYQVYDVTHLLVPGTNILSAYIGEGWYAGRLGRPGIRNIWGDTLGFLGQLHLDGEVAVLTDESWEWNDGPVISGEIYDGEAIDSSLDDPAWWKDPHSKGSVELLSFPKANLLATDAPPVRKIMEIQPQSIITTPSGRRVLDFGQNLVGWVRLERDFDGAGEIVLRFAEVMEDGELGVRPLRTAKVTDRIKLGGRTKGWEPKFTFHGFRYCEVNVVDVDLASFTAVVIMSDLRQTGSFSCSHQVINQLHSNVTWSARGNFVSVPTDCPQRDERLGWTADLQVFTPTANFLFDTNGFLGGWLRDLAADQADHDDIPPEVVPVVSMHGRKVRPMAIWADAAILVPWDLYQSSGETDILERQFTSMTTWLDNGVPRRESGLWSYSAVQYGDWLDPHAPPQFPAHGITDTHLAADAYLVHVTRLVSQIAQLLGKQEQATRYAKDAQKLLKEFQLEYVSPNGRLTSDSQTAIALALKFGLLEAEEQRSHLANRLDHLIRWEGFRISTGFAGTPIILNVLADSDKLHLAYRMLQEGHNPSWLYPVTMGATTINDRGVVLRTQWERWDSMLPNGKINPGQMTSFNHYALGAVAEFLHSVVGGLSPLEPGWKRALIRPRPGGTITSARVSYDSPYGLYVVDWRLDGGQLKVDAQVPANAGAKLILPGVEVEVGSGQHQWSVDWKKDERWPPKIIPGPSSIQFEDTFLE